MNILHHLKTRNGDPCTHEEGVKTYVDRNLVPSEESHEDFDELNDLAKLDVEVRILRRAFGSLVSLLADKGIMNLEEVVNISRGQIGEAEFKETTFETSHL